MSETLLSVSKLTVNYLRDKQSTTAVKEVGFEVKRGEGLALVGESGCGKSTIALSLIGLLPRNESQVSQGEIIFDGHNILKNSEIQWQKLRGKRIAMIFQDPFSSLNPVIRVGEQIEEALSLDSSTALQANTLALLSKVQIADPERIYQSYPHQLSGGQRQRIMIAIALSRQPDLLIADEPTTALDVTVQDEIMKLLKSLQKEMGMAMIFVTHNLGLVKNIADNVAVMRHGEIVENGPAATLLSQPRHPYSKGLLRCMPTLKRTKGPLPTLEETP